MEEIRPSVKSAVFRKISELRQEDERVKVVGLVVDKQGSELTIDDGSGQLSITLDDPSLGVGIDVGSKVRILGIPMVSDEGIELHAEIVQSVEKLNLELYLQVQREIEKMKQEIGD
jgi:RNase P/RNase MRP subunit p29